MSSQNSKRHLGRSIQFIGAAGTVTGSKFLLESDGASPRRLLIDCGLFQGLKTLRLKNWESQKALAQSVSDIVLTHAHIDHSGYIPRFVNEGFRGSIHCSDATRALSQILLPDSGYLQEEEADFLNQHALSKHKPALPLYTLKDAEESLKRFQVHEVLKPFSCGPFQITLYPSGHILGACSVLVEFQGLKILFSGDIGREDDWIMKAPQVPPEVDCVVMESTYGGKNHPNKDFIEALREVLEPTIEKKGVLLIPSFAVGRAQLLLYTFHLLFKKYPHLRVPLFVNSPMSYDATKIFCNYPSYHKLTETQCDGIYDQVNFVRKIEDSIKLNSRDGPMIILSASGMLTGGRILHHMKSFAPNERNTILLVGYQAEGTRGAALKNGAQELKIHGEYIPIRAKVESLDLFSAHADQKGLIHWLRQIKNHPSKIFLTHGEPAALDCLRVKIKSEFGIDAIIPNPNERFGV